MSKSHNAWDACKDAQTAEGAALRSLFGSSPFKVLVNAHVKEQSTRDRDVCDAVIEHIADNYLFAVQAHKTFVSAPLRNDVIERVIGRQDEPAFTSGEVFTVHADDAPVAGWVNLGGPIDRSGGDAAFILALMSQMTVDQRRDAIDAITSRYCAGCGDEQPPRCQCRDDE